MSYSALSIGSVALLLSIWNWNAAPLVPEVILTAPAVLAPAEFTSQCHCQCPAPTPCQAGSAGVAVSFCSWGSLILSGLGGVISGVLLVVGLRKPTRAGARSSFPEVSYSEPVSAPRASTPSTRRRALENGR